MVFLPSLLFTLSLSLCSVFSGLATHVGGGSVTPFPPAPLRALPPLAMAEDEQNLYSASGVLSFIQSTTRRAYQQVLEVLDENHRR